MVISGAPKCNRQVFLAFKREICEILFGIFKGNVVGKAILDSADENIALNDCTLCFLGST